MTGNVKFTAGPWKVDDSFPGVIVGGPLIERDHGHSQPQLAMAMGSSEIDQEERDANARLIAQAPRMYGVLALAAERFRTYEQIHLEKAKNAGPLVLPQLVEEMRLKALANAAIAAEIEAVLADARGEPA